MWVKRFLAVSRGPGRQSVVSRRAVARPPLGREVNVPRDRVLGMR
jgi:hypothetical protein